jgi:surface protein
MKTSKPWSTRSLSFLDRASTASNSTNASTDAPDDHGGDDIKVIVFEFLGNAGESVSTTAASSLAPLAAPSRERVSNGDGLHGKPNSTSGQDYSRPRAYHETFDTHSVASGAPVREQGFNKDEFGRHRLRQTTTAAAPSSSALSDGPPTRVRFFGVDEFNRTSAGDAASAAAPSSLAPSDVEATTDWLSNRDEYNRKLAGETASATAPSSSVPPDAPTTKRGFGLVEFLGKFFPSGTEDQEPDEDYSQRWCFRVAKTLDGTLGVTVDADKVTALPPVPEMHLPEIHQYQEITRAQYLAEATLFSKHDLLVGEIVEESKAFWRQPKVQRRAFLIFLLLVGVVVGVVVVVGGGSTSTSAPSIFDCSNTTIGCLYTGTQLLDFQDPDRLLIANCTDANFEIPSESCDCEVKVNVPTSPVGKTPERCQTCSFVAPVGGGLQVAYDCSNLLGGECVGRDTSDNCIVSNAPFLTTVELRDAVDDYLANNSSESSVARVYGWPIGIWDVSKIEDFSFLFSAFNFEDGNRFNPAAMNFNEDVSGWDMSTATTMRSMFDGARSFDQPIGNWNVSRVTNMNELFYGASSFNQPLADWNVSSVADMSYMLGSAESFNQPIGNWNVSSVTSMSYMFYYASSFNQPLGTWDRSSLKFLTDIFRDSGCRAVRGPPSCDYYDSISNPTNFDCSNTTSGCLLLGFPDPDSLLIANCTDEIPIRENCDCEVKVNVPTSPFGNPESCQTCSFVASADGEWRLAYDCSNVLSGVCVGRDTRNNCIVSYAPFLTTVELRDAVDDYLANNSSESSVARIYGWPIGVWDVSQIEDFSYLFSADEAVFGERFNTAAANFNEDVSGWEVSSATTMTSMFAGARSFDQPIGNWNVSRVTDMSFMFSRALSFDEPLEGWNVSSVMNMGYMFYSATSFNQPLGDWEVSTVRDMRYLFSYATSFDQSYTDWNVSNETDFRGIFTGADGIVEVQVKVQYDDLPLETGWALWDSTGTLIYSQPTGSFTTEGGTVTKTLSVALGTCIFEMIDTEGDGICCSFGSGSFGIAMNGEIVVSNNGQFEGIVQETFEVRAPTP